MEPLAQLGLLAQIAATYSGFIAIFLAFTREGRFEPADAHFVQAMVLGTIGVVVMALTPPVLAQMMPMPDMWWTVSVLGIAGGIPSMAYQAWHQMRVARADTGRIAAGWHLPGWVLGAAATGAFAVGLALPDLRAGFFIAGVSLMLAVSIWCFIAVVFRRFF